MKPAPRRSQKCFVPTLETAIPLSLGGAGGGAASKAMPADSFRNLEPINTEVGLKYKNKNFFRVLYSIQASAVAHLSCVTMARIQLLLLWLVVRIATMLGQTLQQGLYFVPLFPPRIELGLVELNRLFWCLQSTHVN